MENGLVQPSEEGVPQGGAAFTLLSNLMLNNFNRELENGGL